MKYGERLHLAMVRRGKSLGQEVTRQEVADAAGRSVQNIGMILADAKKKDQKLAAVAHAKVAAFLKVNPDWLLSGSGSIDPTETANHPAGYTEAALDVALMFDQIPASERLIRAQAFAEIRAVILRLMPSEQPKDQGQLDLEKPSA